MAEIPDALIEQAAKVVDDHQYDTVQVDDWRPYRPACKCGWISEADFAPVSDHDEHVARAVLEAVADDLRADAWDEGYVRGVVDTTSDLEPADNPYRRGDQ